MNCRQENWAQEQGADLPQARQLPAALWHCCSSDAQLLSSLNPLWPTSPMLDLMYKGWSPHNSLRVSKRKSGVKSQGLLSAAYWPRSKCKVSLNDLVSFSSRDTESRHGVDAVLYCCHGDHCLNHNLSGQATEVRARREAGLKCPLFVLLKMGCSHAALFAYCAFRHRYSCGLVRASKV